MTGIVERLRVFGEEGFPVALEAATEIERLRTRVESLRGSLKSASGLLLDAGDLEHADWCAEQAGDMEP